MQIQSDKLIEHIEERLGQIARQCVESKTKAHDETQFDRGRYAAYKEMINYLNTNYSYE